MTINRRWMGRGIALLSVAGAFAAGRLWASGIPATAALTYSGALEDVNGAPLTGDRNIQVNFWNSATPGTAPLCQTPSKAVTLAAGRFSVALPDTCTTAVQGNKDVWVEALVDGSSLGLSKLGAVPYAVEAAHADTATNATNAMHAATATSATTAAHVPAEADLDARLKKLETAAVLTEITSVSIGPENFADADSKSHVNGCNATLNAQDCSLIANRYCVGNGFKAGMFVGETGDGVHRSINCIK